MKFIHVIRDGRDMVFSENQRQVTLFGQIILNKENPTELLDKLRFWSLMNLKTARYGEDEMKENYMYVKFEDLCNKKEKTVKKILVF